MHVVDRRLNWFYDWPFSNYRLNQSLPMEWGLGFDTIGCPNEDFRNIQCGTAHTLTAPCARKLIWRY